MQDLSHEGKTFETSLTPNAALAVTNNVFLHGKEDEFQYVAIRKKGSSNWYSFVAQGSFEVEPGQVALNTFHRKALGVEQGHAVEVRLCHTEKTAKDTRYQNETVPLNSIEVEIDVVRPAALQNKRITLKEDDVLEHLAGLQNPKKRTPLRLFTQEITNILSIGGLFVMFTVTKAQALRVTGSYTESFSYRCGVLTPETQIRMTPKSSPGFVFIPATTEANQKPLFNMNFKFEDLGIGGLDAQAGEIFRRAFASRLLRPEIIRKNNIHHVKGMLLYGPPGTGKTLIARKIGSLLGGNEPKIVSGPEILNKYVGSSEENIRNLFADAIAEYETKKEESSLHVIIFDEIDSICKARGSVRSGTGVHDTVVNQLLTMMDGPKSLGNILVIGMTNRKDLLDEALLRPGRMEVHIEIGLPDEPGREQIFRIHTKSLRESGSLALDVNLATLAKRTPNYSGAEIEAVVRSALSYVIAKVVDVSDASKNPKNVSKEQEVTLLVEQKHFDLALEEIRPAFGMDEGMLDRLIGGDSLIPYTTRAHDHKMFYDNLLNLITSFKNSTLNLTSILLKGPIGSGKTAIAASLAKDSEFLFVKPITAASLLGMNEYEKINHINSIFDRAYKSQLSLVLIDNIETMMEYIHLGPRFSNNVLQSLVELISTPHPRRDAKLLILATSGKYDSLDELGVTDAFDYNYIVPAISSFDGVQSVCQHLGLATEPSDACYEDIPAIGIKRLIKLLSFHGQTPDEYGKIRPITPKILRGYENQVSRRHG